MLPIELDVTDVRTAEPSSQLAGLVLMASLIVHDIHEAQAD